MKDTCMSQYMRENDGQQRHHGKRGWEYYLKVDILNNS